MTWYNVRQDKIVDNDHIMSNFETLKDGQRYLTHTTAQRLALTHSIGLIVYDTDLKSLYVSNGTFWVEVK